MVVAGSHTLRRKDLEKSLTALELVGAHVLGFVLNRLPVKGPDSYSYTYYSQDSTFDTNKRPGSTPGQGTPLFAGPSSVNIADEERLLERPATVFPSRRSGNV